MDSLSELLGNLRPEDMQQLRDAAEAMFGGGTNNPSDGYEDDTPPEFDPAFMRRIARIMHAMQSSHSERTALIRALQPYLSEPRRKRAQEAMQLLRLLDVLPMLQDAGKE